MKSITLQELLIPEDGAIETDKIHTRMAEITQTREFVEALGDFGHIVVMGPSNIDQILETYQARPIEDLSGEYAPVFADIIYDELGNSCRVLLNLFDLISLRKTVKGLSVDIAEPDEWFMSTIVAEVLPVIPKMGFMEDVLPEELIYDTPLEDDVEESDEDALSESDLVQYCYEQDIKHAWEFVDNSCLLSPDAFLDVIAEGNGEVNIPELYQKFVKVNGGVSPYMAEAIAEVIMGKSTSLDKSIKEIHQRHYLEKIELEENRIKLQ